MAFLFLSSLITVVDNKVFVFLVSGFLYFIEGGLCLFFVDDFSKGLVWLSVFVFVGLFVLFSRVFLRICFVGILRAFLCSSFFWFLVIFEFVLLPVSLVIWLGKRGERFLRVAFFLGFTLVFSFPFFLLIVKETFSGSLGFWTVPLLGCFPSRVVVLAGFVFLVKFPVFLLHV